MVAAMDTALVGSSPSFDPTGKQNSGQNFRQQAGGAFVAPTAKPPSGTSRTASPKGSPKAAQGEAPQQGNNADSLTLSPEAQQEVSQLQQRDREVRSHEQSHMAAGGAHVTSGPHYTYQRGPDNRQYAIGGSVSIDTSPEPGNPEATKAKARQVRSAALAPGNPSAQDQSVAAEASALEMQAQQDVQAQKGSESPGATKKADPARPTSFTEKTQNTMAPRQADLSLALAAYARQQQQSSLPTALAPWGTGIAFTV